MVTHMASVRSAAARSRKVKAGVVGVGDVARKIYLAGIITAPNVELVACATISPIELRR